MNTRPLAERFSEKYERLPWSGCWVWTGALSGGGPYGSIWDGKQRRSHRVSYELHCGQIPVGMDVCHSCDSPLCVNPDHLFLGTRQDNNLDKTAKGRTTRGERSWAAKITEEDVRAIRADQRPQKEICAQYGLNNATVSRIKSRQRWRYLP